MEDVLSQLIYHMERTTLYRYSMKKADKKPVNINDIMYEVPDIIDDVIDNTCTFTFCLDNIPDILINPDQLKTLLTEAVQNACEASDCTGEITLITRKKLLIMGVCHHTMILHTYLITLNYPDLSIQQNLVI